MLCDWWIGQLVRRGLSTFALVSEQTAKTVGSEQTFRAAVKEVVFTGRVVYITGSISSEVSERKT